MPFMLCIFKLLCGQSIDRKHGSATEWMFNSEWFLTLVKPHAEAKVQQLCPPPTEGSRHWDVSPRCPQIFRLGCQMCSGGKAEQTAGPPSNTCGGPRPRPRVPGCVKVIKQAERILRETFNPLATTYIRPWGQQRNRYQAIIYDSKSENYQRWETLPIAQCLGVLLMGLWYYQHEQQIEFINHVFTYSISLRCFHLSKNH